MYAAFSVVAFVAAILSIYLMGWTLQHEGKHSTYTLASAGVAFWILAVISETGFFAYLLWPNRRQEDAQPFEVAVERPSPVRSMKRSLSVHLATLTPTPPKFNRSKTEPYSPTDSAYAPSSRSSFRQSMSQALRPMGSKTRLLRRSFVSGDASPSLYSGRRLSFDTVRQQDDGFETWDTSAVEEGYSESPTLHKTKLRLDPIPGSRPVSPAKPLDGPFPDERSPEDTPLPESPLQHSFAAMASETSLVGGFPLSSLRRPSAGQSHIHPLFRPESPMPPPLASPSTVITASPYAGQIVSSEQAMSARRLYSAQGNWPVGATPPGSRPGSSKSARTLAASPVEPPPPLPAHESVRPDS
ncbi:hypothetical protein LTR85_003688 [Meristemomyces frigidus]|nr:hypothetical protein LTR85_003688 [Meristemomyces frigidus]